MRSSETILLARALQSAVETQDPPPSMEKICEGAFCRSLQSLAHTNVKTIYPQGFTEERGPQSFSSGAIDWGATTLILIL